VSRYPIPLPYETSEEDKCSIYDEGELKMPRNVYMQGNKNCVEECDEGCLNHPFESQYSIQPKLVRDTQLLIRNLI
jgi:hypothetical protein